MTLEEKIRFSLRYDPNDGKVYWVNRPLKPKSAGTEAGNVNSKGYRKIKIDGKQYLTHRVGWFLYYGTWPKHEIDHIDGDKLNNRIENLRDVPHRVNLQNIKNSSYPNRTGFPGVRHHNGRYAAYITVNYKQIHLGMFDDPELAHRAYLNYQSEVNHG